MEWSKQLTIFDNVIFVSMAALLLIIMFLREPLAQYCVSMLGTFATVFVSVRLGYEAKAGVENYQKIRNSFAEPSKEKEESDFERSYEGDEEEPVEENEDEETLG